MPRRSGSLHGYDAHLAVRQLEKRVSKEFNQEVLLAEVHDAFGRIRVVEIGDYRFLEFGEQVEQSCVFTRDPAWLEYDYTRAMLLGALLHEAPETALFLGLGAGNLTQCCLQFLPLEDVEVIELRPEVPIVSEVT